MTIIKAMAKVAVPLVFMLGAMQASAQAIFLSELAGDAKVPKTYGISVDYFGLEQGFDIDDLNFTLPGVVIDDTVLGDVDVDSDTDYAAFKFDAWIFPFLNAFIVGGQIEGDTIVDLSQVSIEGLPIELNNLSIPIDGNVFGGGLTLAYANNDGWFFSLTSTFTDTNLTGEFSSSIEAFTLQPRIGKRLGRFDVWVTALYLETEESHSGDVSGDDLGLGIFGIDALPFEAVLEQREDVNFGVGLMYQLTDSFNITVDLGFGERENQFVGLNYRF